MGYESLKGGEYLTYNISCCYIQYHEPCGYGIVEFEVASCLGIYALKYYFKLECDYQNYFHHHRTTISNKWTLVTIQMDDMQNETMLLIESKLILNVGTD